MKLFNKLEEWIGGTLFVGMFIILVLQIISRQILDDPLIWSEELARLFFVYVGMLGISMGIRTQSHVMIDFVYARLPEKLQKIIFTGIQMIIFLCISSFSYFGYLLIEKKADIELVSLGISAKWMYIALPVISVLMLIRFFQAYQENWENKKVLISPKIILAFMIIFMALLIFQPSVFKVFKLTQYFKLRGNSVYVALLLWLVLIFAGVPVGWSLLASSMVYFSMTKWAVAYFASSKFVDSVDSFSLLSVPFFILTGILMNGSGITERIFYFAKATLGHYTGGMGHVNVAASLIFSGITAASCIIGPLVPPSISMIIYGVIANQSIAKLFLAGFVPGVLTTIALMIMNYFVCKKRGYKKAKKCTSKERWEAFKRAFWALLTPIIIIGGIFSGMFTPTEAAVVAALYSVILGMFIYKELTLKALFQHCVEAMAISGVTVLMIITVTFFGDMIAREQVAMKIAEVFIQFASSPLTVLLMINLLLLFLGMFIDALALQFLVLPMLIPVAEQVGIDLVFFGVMTTLNMMIGILTPPMGMALFVVAQVGKMPVSTVTKGVLPFLIPIFVTLVVITIFPQIIIFLPNLIMGA